MRILSIRIVLSCFYPLISHFELEFATNAMHNLPIDGKREKAARGKNVLLDHIPSVTHRIFIGLTA